MKNNKKLLDQISNLETEINEILLKLSKVQNQLSLLKDEIHDPKKNIFEKFQSWYLSFQNDAKFLFYKNVNFQVFQHLEKIEGKGHNIVGPDPIFNLNFGTNVLAPGNYKFQIICKSKEDREKLSNAKIYFKAYGESFSEENIFSAYKHKHNKIFLIANFKNPVTAIRLDVAENKYFEFEIRKILLRRVSTYEEKTLQVLKSGTMHHKPQDYPEDNYVGYEQKFSKKFSNKPIAFYLPQYHEIPENNKWWGKGFTEWTNVKKSKQVIEEHTQPDLPNKDIGLYSLDKVSTLKRQAKIARNYGVYGFNIYFYWFNGKTLLENPLNLFYENKDIDINFSICWANENWTKTWDGKDNEILIEQKHSKKDDLSFIKYISKYFDDDRYIKINGKPLISVYRPSLLPDIQATFKIWRDWCREAINKDIHIAYTDSFDDFYPDDIGADSVIEFPPNRTGPLTAKHTKLSTFSNPKVYSLNSVLLKSKEKETNERTLRGMCPSWDNTPRRGKGATIFLDNSSQQFKDWSNFIFEENSKFPDREGYCFINAWNEWGEGANLEPTEKYGYRYLEKLNESLNENESSEKIAIVTHDLFQHGAQLLALNIGADLKSTGHEIAFISLLDGPLKDQYASVGDLHIPTPEYNIEDIARNLRQKGFQKAIINTTVGGIVTDKLKNSNFKCINLIHELSSVLEDYNLKDHAQIISNYSDEIIFPSSEVHESFKKFLGTKIKAKTSILTQGIYKKSKYYFFDSKDELKNMARKKLKISSNKKIILGCGFADERKGFDLYLESASKLMKTQKNVYAIWIGNFKDNFSDKMFNKLVPKKLRKNFYFPGFVENTEDYYAAADIFALTSREDPFPSVIFESFETLTPIVGFHNAGGFENLFSSGYGILVKHNDTDALAKAYSKILKRCPIDVSKSKDLLYSRFNLRKYNHQLLSKLGVDSIKISVIVPNYNYGDLIYERLKNVSNQKYNSWEIIILDDCSTDNSCSEIERFINDFPLLPIKFIKNKKNSGNVFKQWLKGSKEATGDYIWIAEADDLADTSFLPKMEKTIDENIGLSFCMSNIIDENTKSQGSYDDTDYLKQTNINWNKNKVFSDASDKSQLLGIRNTILNASSALIKRNLIIKPLEDLVGIKKMRFCGDWYTYIDIAKNSNIAYRKDKLNYHRRHTESITSKSFKNDHFIEMEKIHTIAAKSFNLKTSQKTEQNKFRNDAIKEHQGIKDNLRIKKV